MKHHTNITPSARPFPYERKSQALREEDAFLALHSASGSRAIYLGVCGIAYTISSLISLIRLRKGHIDASSKALNKRLSP